MTFMAKGFLLCSIVLSPLAFSEIPTAVGQSKVHCVTGETDDVGRSYSNAVLDAEKQMNQALDLLVDFQISAPTISELHGARINNNKVYVEMCVTVTKGTTSRP